MGEVCGPDTASMVVRAAELPEMRSS